SSLYSGKLEAAAVERQARDGRGSGCRSSSDQRTGESNEAAIGDDRTNQVGPRRMRAGSMKSARRNSNTPSTAKPSRRNGSAISHTIGHRINASSASGQQ